MGSGIVRLPVARPRHAGKPGHAVQLHAGPACCKAGYRNGVHVQGVFKLMLTLRKPRGLLTDRFMRTRMLLLAAALAGLAIPAQALRGPNDVRDMVRAGEIMPFEVIQRRVMQENAGEYMGAQFDQSARIYRFRFLRDGSLINVDVDARTGERVRRRQSY
jgi:hypothetical protein